MTEKTYINLYNYESTRYRCKTFLGDEGDYYRERKRDGYKEEILVSVSTRAIRNRYNEVFRSCTVPGEFDPKNVSNNSYTHCE